VNDGVVLSEIAATGLNYSLTCSDGVVLSDRTSYLWMVLVALLLAQSLTINSSTSQALIIAQTITQGLTIRVGTSQGLRTNNEPDEGLTIQLRMEGG